MRVIHIRTLKQALNHGFILKKVHILIKFIQKDWFKTYIDMNAELGQEAKNKFEKYCFKLMNNAVFQETMKYTDITLVTAERRGSYLVSEPNCHTTKFFTEKL